MTRGRLKRGIVLGEDEPAQLTSLASSRSLPAGLSARARIALSGDDVRANLSSNYGQADSLIADRLKLLHAMVGTWRRPFSERRVAGLYDDVRLPNL